MVVELSWHRRVLETDVRHARMGISIDVTLLSMVLETDERIYIYIHVGHHLRIVVVW